MFPEKPGISLNKQNKTEQDSFVDNLFSELSFGKKRLDGFDN